MRVLRGSRRGQAVARERRWCWAAVIRGESAAATAGHAVGVTVVGGCADTGTAVGVHLEGGFLLTAVEGAIALSCHRNRGLEMGRNATRAQQAKARVREARLALLSQRQEQDQRIEDATVRAVLAWEDVGVVQSQLEAAERHVGDALASLGQEKVTVVEMVALTGIARTRCLRLLKLASTLEHAGPPPPTEPTTEPATEPTTEPAQSEPTAPSVVVVVVPDAAR